MIKAVIFDLDDTLCNTSEAVSQVLPKVYEENLIHFPGKTVEEMVALNERAYKETFLNKAIPIPVASILLWFKIFEYLHITPPVKPIYKIIQQFREEIINKLTLTDGADEIFSYLKSKKIKIGLLTNGSFIEQVQKLTALNIDTQFDYVVATEMCFVDKPDPKAFQYILSKLHAKPQEGIMIGDLLPTDVLGARGVGMRGVLLRQKHRKYSPQEEKRADFVATDLTQLIDYIQKINR